MYERLYALYDYETFDDRSPIPQRFQSIYPHKFSVGTIQSAGCGISSLSMVASYLFDEEITPDMMLKYDYGDKPATALEAGIRDMQLNCEIYYGTAALENLDKALEEGRPVIALHQKGSRFTKAGHFLVMAGTTPTWKITTIPGWWMVSPTVFPGRMSLPVWWAFISLTARIPSPICGRPA